MASNLTLIIGGAASGKTAFAENLVGDQPGQPVYIATGQPFDAEMTAKITRHRAQRGAHWQTLEVPVDLAAALSGLPDQAPVLIDCATMWLSNLMHHDADVTSQTSGLIAAMSRHTGPVTIVTNETGLGIVPDNPLARAFRQAQGELNQQIAAAADRVILITAGLPLALKGALE